MNIKKDEWLGFEDTNKGLEVLKQKPLDYYSDVFSPWQTKQKLKIWREVEWNISGWAKCYTNSFTRLASEWTGIWTITWIVDSEWKPFIPKIVQIYAWRNTSSTNISFWTWMNNPSTSQCIITTSVWTTFNFSNIIWVWIDANLLNSWSWEVRLNISTVYHDTYLVITCFW